MNLLRDEKSASSLMGQTCLYFHGLKTTWYLRLWRNHKKKEIVSSIFCSPGIRRSEIMVLSCLQSASSQHKTVLLVSRQDMSNCLKLFLDDGCVYVGTRGDDKREFFGRDEETSGIGRGNICIHRAGRGCPKVEGPN